MLKKIGLIWMIAAAVALAVGCSGAGGNSSDGARTDAGSDAPNSQNTSSGGAESATPAPTPEPTPEPDPVELLMYVATGLTDEEFKAFVQDPVKAKYPHITVNMMRSDEVNTREGIVAAGTFPDLIYDSGTSYWDENGSNLLEPLNAWIEKYNFDTSVIAKGYEQQKSDGTWTSFPVSGNFVGVWLNLDIFDLFGVTPPKEIMTWEQIFDLSTQLTRMHDGVQYVGLFPDTHFMARGMGADVYIDPDTNKAAVENEHISKIFTLAKQVVETPGFIIDGKYRHRRNEWLKEKYVGMVIATGNQMIGPLNELHKSGKSMNWDLAPFPNFEDYLGQSPSDGAQIVLMTNQSKHKDAAFQVMMTMLSEESQSKVSQSARLPVIENDAVQGQYAAGLAGMEGKNFDSIFQTSSAPSQPMTPWNSTIGKNVLEEYFAKVIEENLDVNTALMLAAEEINKRVQLELVGK